MASDFEFCESRLIKYANQDEIAGKDNGNQYGTEFTTDGNILYALIRYLQPQEVLEIGTHLGGSAMHIAAGLLDDGGGGYVETVDIDENAGSGIHAFYNSVLTQVTANIDLYLPELIFIPS
jgi:predicted O-methyltransferase YrrM